MTGYWIIAYQSISLIPIVARRMAIVRSKVLVRPTPERLVRRPSSRVGALDSGCAEADGEKEESLVWSLGTSFSLDIVSGKKKMETMTETDIRLRLTIIAMYSVPPLPSKFISQPPMGGQMAWETNCIEVVRKKRDDLSSIDGITSVYEANSIAIPRSKFPPISPGRPVKYRVHIGRMG